MARLVKVYANLEAFKDRHGKERHYFRKSGHKRIPVKGTFGSHEFDESYEAAKASVAAPSRPGESSIRPGTVDDLCARYYDSYGFKNLKAPSQKHYRHQIEAFRSVMGFMMVRSLAKRHFNQIKSDMAERPGACRTLLKRLTTLLNFAIDEEMIDINPMARVKLPEEGDGFTPWSDEDIKHYLLKWGAGTRERLGLYLCLFTGQRRSDVVRMTQSDIRDHEIRVVQQKSSRRFKAGKQLWIPLHPLLQAELALWPHNQKALIVNSRGGAFSSEGFGNWLRQAAKDVNLNDQGVSFDPPLIEGTRGPHGLRKAAARRLIEAGCDGESARAITGHASEKELAVYIRDVNQLKKARQAIGKLDQEKV
ncbi:tyrosine-type recombinase/integrase [Asticcacaulis endophyticus]|uniref:Integrase/recombinase n=1 Tax=Asticcacaulis endophyticus TaxID=1395890 RepID=A0A918PVB1_9CAUL|nr:tyrosine-type recombinase/integrase [Asticcacaulis endophyticus]GGZ22087.1 integrase/recombinase [Asticcacaulis endophyticus]